MNCTVVKTHRSPTKAQIKQDYIFHWIAPNGGLRKKSSLRQYFCVRAFVSSKKIKAR